MHVVVNRSMNQQQLAVKIFCEVNWRTLPVAIGIVLRRAHVALCVDRVVVAPVSDRAAGDPDLEGLAMCQRVARHESAIAPTPDADARSINVRLRLQPRESIFEIA